MENPEVWKGENTFSASGNGITVSRKSLNQISCCADNAIRAPILLDVSLVNFYFLDLYFYLEHLMS
jgi:hypothetical protein